MPKRVCAPPGPHQSRYHDGAYLAKYVFQALCEVCFDVSFKIGAIDNTDVFSGNAASLFQVCDNALDRRDARKPLFGGTSKRRPES